MKEAHDRNWHGEQHGMSWLILTKKAPLTDSDAQQTHARRPPANGTNVPRPWCPSVRLFCAWNSRPTAKSAGGGEEYCQVPGKAQVVLSRACECWAMFETVEMVGCEIELLSSNLAVAPRRATSGETGGGRGALFDGARSRCWALVWSGSYLRRWRQRVCADNVRCDFVKIHQFYHIPSVVYRLNCIFGCKFWSSFQHRRNCSDWYPTDNTMAKLRGLKTKNDAITQIFPGVTKSRTYFDGTPWAVKNSFYFVKDRNFVI